MIMCIMYLRLLVLEVVSGVMLLELLISPQIPVLAQHSDMNGTLGHILGQYIVKILQNSGVRHSGKYTVLDIGTLVRATLGKLIHPCHCSSFDTVIRDERSSSILLLIDPDCKESNVGFGDQHLLDMHTWNLAFMLT